MANYANELSGKRLEILKKSSRQNLVCEKSKFCKIQGMSKGSKLHAACYMLHGMLQGCTKYPMSKESKEIKIAIIQ